MTSHLAGNMEAHPIVDHRADRGVTKIVDVQVRQASLDARRFPRALDVVIRQPCYRIRKWPFARTGKFLEHGQRRLAERNPPRMRAIDALRDAAQHWFVFVSEDLLYLQTRALITSFDAYLQRILEDALANHIPPRVLPISTMPPGDFEFLIDKEFTLVAELLKPGRRARDEARARIRSMLAMEAIVTEEVEISERDIDRIEKAMRGGTELTAVFPRLATVGTSTNGEGVNLTVHFTKKQGAPVQYVGGDDPTAAAAVREIDLRKKFHLQATPLADKVGLTPPKAKVLRVHLGLDQDPSCIHVFEFGSQKIPCFSDNAVAKMKEALAGVDMNELWANRKNPANAIPAAA